MTEKTRLAMHVRMTGPMHDVLRKMAFERRLSINALITLALAEFIRKQEEYNKPK